MQHLVDWELLAKYLSGECSPSELKLVQQWLEENPLHVKYVDQLKLVWKETGQSVNFNPNIEQAWEKIKRNIDVKDKSVSNHRFLNFNSWAFRVAAMLVLVVGVSLVIYYISSISSSTLKEVKTGVQQKLLIRLEDSTLITLNQNSYLRYPSSFKKEQREIWLEGEAYLEVAHRPSQPFIIYTDKATTKVLGTSFVISSYPSDSIVSVIVVSGKVQLSKSNSVKENIYLTKGFTGVFYKKDNLLKKTENTDPNFLSWKTGKFYFDQTPLSEVVNYLDGYYPYVFSIKDSSLKTIRLTSIFDQQSMQDVLKIMELSLHLSYTIKKDTVYLY